LIIKDHFWAFSGRIFDIRAWGVRIRIVKTITPTAQKQPQPAPAPTTANTPAPLVRAEVVAKQLDVHKRTVCLWAQQGVIPSIRIGGIVRFDLQQVMETAR